MTQSLLSAWGYIFKAYDADEAYDSFLKTLRRELTETTEAMQDGIDFESMVITYCKGGVYDLSSPWHNAAKKVAKIVYGSAFQVPLYTERTLNGITFLLYGRADALKAGTCYDIKFSQTYEPGKYLDSPQHPMYMACEPLIRRFEYVVSDGVDVFTETYSRADTPPIEREITAFMSWLESAGLQQTYFDLWRAKN
jgi:hypothetical protein